MSDYIDREALLEKIKKRYCSKCKTDDHCRACWVDDMIGEIEDAPAADVAPVVHATWIFFRGVGEHFPRCSRCGEEADEEIARPYCAFCGARMDMPHKFDYSDDRKRKDGGRK